MPAYIVTRPGPSPGTWEEKSFSADDGAAAIAPSEADRQSGLKVKLRYADAATIGSVADRHLAHDNPAIEVPLSRNTLKRMLKISSWNLTHITIRASVEQVAMTIADVRNPISTVFELPLTDVVRHDATFTRSMSIPMSMFKLLLPGDYMMSLAGKWHYVYLAHRTLPITYYVAEYKMKE